MAKQNHSSLAGKNDNSSTNETNDKKTILVIGGGWYGCHTALELAKKNYQVILVERNAELFSELSGNYGVRLHKGPHYLRSPATRQACREGYDEFKLTYPDLVVEHELSIYALATINDQLGNPPKVTSDEFESVFNEEYSTSEDINHIPLTNTASAKKLEEHSIVGGTKLCKFFMEELTRFGVEIHCNANVTDIEKLNNGQIKIIANNQIKIADYVVNATSFKAFSPSKEETLPFGMEVKYQCTLILLYDDLESTASDKPSSLIWMDGSYPCIMPYIGRANTDTDAKHLSYLLYHGSLTIQCTADTLKEAQDCLDKLNDEYVQNIMKPQFEAEISKFLPDFTSRFKYKGWNAATLAKIRSNTEFRTTVTFKRKDMNWSDVFPGKINDIFKMAREIEAHIESRNLLTNGSYQYVQSGTLDLGQIEIATKPISNNNSCNLNFVNIPKSSLRRVTASKRQVNNNNYSNNNNNNHSDDERRVSSGVRKSNSEPIASRYKYWTVMPPTPSAISYSQHMQNMRNAHSKSHLNNSTSLRSTLPSFKDAKKIPLKNRLSNLNNQAKARLFSISQYSPRSTSDSNEGASSKKSGTLKNCN